MRLPASVLQGILARAALVFLRIFLGLVFLLAGWAKLQTSPPPNFLAGVPRGTGYPAYEEVFGRVVLPHVEFIATAVTWSQMLVGIALLLGLLTRLSAILALILAVNSILATGTVQEAGYAAIAIALLIGAAGRTFGLDGMLARRWPRSALW
jgi:thiosulfate dehydrogenase [quinone] large subunit